MSVDERDAQVDAATIPGVEGGRSTVHLVVGLLIWAAWFVLIYSGVSLACQVAPPRPEQGLLNWINAALLLSGLAVTLLLFGLAYLYVRRARMVEAPQLVRFLRGVAAAGCVAAGLSTLFVCLPMVLIPACV